MIDASTRILIVDDQDLVGDILRGMLGALGAVQVEQATDGWDALLRLRSQHFDMALVDVNLGSVSGLQLLRSIRRDRQLRQLLVLLITSDRSEGIVREAKAALVNGVLHKPFSRSDLGTAIADVFRVWRPRPDPGQPPEQTSPDQRQGVTFSGRSHYLEG